MTSSGLSKFADDLGGVNDNLSSFIKTWDGTGGIAEKYQIYLSNATGFTTKFSSTLKSTAANLGIMLAASIAIKAISTAWDKANVTLEEQQQIVDDLNTEITSLKEEEEKLLSLRYAGLH